MEIETIFIDTNAYAEYKRGNEIASGIINKSSAIVFSPIVLGELFSGFILGSKEARNRIELEEFMKSKRVLSIRINTKTAEYYALVYKQLKSKGKPIPTNDLWIAALCMQYDLPLFSFDKHFEYIDNFKLVKLN